MLYNGFDSYLLEDGEPVYRSCWECNDAHLGLKEVSSLHYCLFCGRYWMFGRYLDSFDSPEALDEFLKVRLVHSGTSSEQEEQQ